MEKQIKQTKFNGRTFKKYGFVVSMLIIPIISWLVFWLYSNIDMILLAFKDVSGHFTTQNFVSFWNELTAPGGEIGISLRNTFLYFGLNILLVLPLSTLVAYFIFKKIFAHKVIRVLIFLPSIVPGIWLRRSKSSLSLGGLWRVLGSTSRHRAGLPTRKRRRQRLCSIVCGPDFRAGCSL